MGVYLFDSSAILKRYVNEAGSAWVNGLVGAAKGNDIYLVRIAGAEMAAAIARRSRGGGVAPPRASAAIAQLRAEFVTAYTLLEVDAALVDNAMLLAVRHGLRGYDAIQLAGAVKVQAFCTAANAPFVFVSSDSELNTAALAEGVVVDDPNTHP